VLAAAPEMTADGSMTDQTWEALSKHLEVARLVELVIVSTFYGAITRVLSTLQVDVEPKYGGYLQTFPWASRRNREGRARRAGSTPTRHREEEDVQHRARSCGGGPARGQGSSGSCA
jgi:hypothetical protein